MPQSSMAHTAFVNLDQVTVTEVHVPMAFTDEDIMQFVGIEQAQLFPMLDQEIYFDFLIKSSDEDNKKLIIVACNRKDFKELVFCSLKVRDENLKTLDLFPWRQREKVRVKKKELKILMIVATSTSVLMLVISFFYMHVAHQDKKRLTALAYRKQVVISKLTTLEKSNQALQVLVYRWQDQVDTARQYSGLEKMLITIDMQRPPNLTLEKILWKNNRVLIKGKVKKVSAIKIYRNHLAKNRINTQLKFMGASVDQEFPIQFEIEAMDLLA